jgi:hypothetical protein
VSIPVTQAFPTFVGLAGASVNTQSTPFTQGRPYLYFGPGQLLLEESV